MLTIKTISLSLAALAVSGGVAAAASATRLHPPSDPGAGYQVIPVQAYGTPPAYGPPAYAYAPRAYAPYGPVYGYAGPGYAGPYAPYGAYPYGSYAYGGYYAPAPTTGYWNNRPYSGGHNNW